MPRTRTNPVVLLAGLLVGVIAAGDEPPAAKADAAAVPRGLVVDSTWKPKPGDMAKIHTPDGNEALVAADISAYRDMVKAANAKDLERLRQMLVAGRLVAVPDGTDVLVLQVQGDRVVTGSPTLALEVRLKGDEHNEQVGWALAPSVARLVPGPPPAGGPSPSAKKPAPRSIDPEVRAATLLRSARALEKSGRRAGALLLYRDIVKDHPRTTAAAEAAARIRALAK